MIKLEMHETGKRQKLTIQLLGGTKRCTTLDQVSTRSAREEGKTKTVAGQVDDKRRQDEDKTRTRRGQDETRRGQDEDKTRTKRSQVKHNTRT